MASNMCIIKSFLFFALVIPHIGCAKKSSSDTTSTLTTDVREKRNLHNSVYGVEGGVSPQFSNRAYHPQQQQQHHHQQQYPEPPEPIIEIVIQDNEETLPPPEPQLTHDGTPKKEQVQVFYVKYKKDDNNQLVIESPIAALSPPSHQQDSSHTDDHHSQKVSYVTPAPIVRKSTTLRTIIRPDSKTYETNSGVHVTFDSPDNHHSKSDKHVGDASEKHESFVSHPQSDFIGTGPKDKRNSQYFGVNPSQNVINSNVPQQTHHNNYHPNPNQELPHIHQQHRFSQSLPSHEPVRNFNQQNYFPNQHQPQQQQQQYHQSQPSVQQYHQSQPQSQPQIQPYQHQQNQQFRQPPISRPIPVTSQPPQQQQQQHNFNTNNHVKFPINENRFQQPPSPPQQHQQQQHFQQPPKNYQQTPFNFLSQPSPHPNLVAHPLPPQYPQQQFKVRPQQPSAQQVTVADKQVQQSVQPGIKYHHQQSQAQPQVPYTNNHHSQQTSFPPRFNHEQQQANNNVFQGGLIQQNAPNLVNKQEQQRVPQVHANNLIKSAFGGDVVQVQASLPKYEHHITEQYNPPIFLPSASIDTQVKQQPQKQQKQQQQSSSQNQPQIQPQHQNIQLNDHYTNQFAQISNYYSDVFPQQKSNVNERLQALNNFDINNYKINQPTTARNYPIEISNTPAPTKLQTTTTNRPSTTTPIALKPDPVAVAQLPDEVPDDLREQLLSSGILANAQISILDYDKIGSTNLQDLPPDHLEHFFSAGGGALAGSNKVLSVARPDEKHVKKDTGFKIKEKVQQMISEDIKKTKYSRYESFKLNGDNFPLPQIDELENKLSKKVVILTPITNEEDESGPQSEIKRQKINGDELLRNLLRKQSTYNFEQWLRREERKNPEDQSVILLLTVDIKNFEEDIFMYDITAKTAHRLDGELSRKFIKMAKDISNEESNEEFDASPASSEIVETYLKPEPSSRNEEIVINSGYSNIK